MQLCMHMQISLWQKMEVWSTLCSFWWVLYTWRWVSMSCGYVISICPLPATHFTPTITVLQCLPHRRLSQPPQTLPKQTPPKQTPPKQTPYYTNSSKSSEHTKKHLEKILQENKNQRINPAEKLLVWTSLIY